MIIHTLSNCKWNTGYLGIPRYFITIPYRFVFSDTVQPYTYVHTREHTICVSNNMGEYVSHG